MIISLIKKDKIYNLALPATVYGDYWVSDKDPLGNERKLLNIAEINGEWQINSNHEAQLVKDNMVINYTIIKENEYYQGKITNSDDRFLVYARPFNDNTFRRMIVKQDTEIFIGKANTNNIMYQNEILDDNQIKLTLKQGIWTVENIGTKELLYVNDINVKMKALKHGDNIFLMGLRIIVIGDKIVINNPNNKVFFDNKIFTGMPDVERAHLEETPSNFELPYEEINYFYRSPRFRSPIERAQIEIDPAPGKENLQQMPLLYMIGPMMTMAMTSMVTAYSAINNIVSNGYTLGQALPQLLISFAMLSSTLLWPLLTKRYQKKQKIKREKFRQQKYSAYIETKRQEIAVKIHEQRQILLENYTNMEELASRINNRKRNLWERQKEQDDFLQLRLGIGDLPLDADIKYPEEHFSLDEDNLRDILQSLVKQSKDLREVPITVNLCKKNISALVGRDDFPTKYMEGLILQLISLHSYEDVKLVFLLSEKNADKWDYLRALPHCWSDHKDIRFFATNMDEAKEISSYLEKVIFARQNKDEEGTKQQENAQQADYRSFSPYYVIIAEDVNLAKKLSIVDHVLHQDVNVGFSIMFLTNRLSILPQQCSTFINVEPDVSGIIENELSASNQKKFIPDFNKMIDPRELCVKAANIPIELAGARYQLPNMISFLEMYKVGRVEQLNSLSRWSMNNPVQSLMAPIGVDVDGELFKLDLHEKYHGPHGLIAGMTGSGKSEFIITYILSLAVNYHPNEVQFILIDYKGGGLTGAFENKERGIKLPHLAGTITNLDIAEIKRALVSIQSELRRRQAAFNEARELLGEGTIDIYKYQRLYREGLVKEPISHLFIISDEFAELKAQQPDFMDQLISTARIGRSLGVHLILATQKPAGVVNDQIWSNSKFRVCLKVQEKADSQDMIKCPDAAALKETGRFYLQVGYNEFFALGQSAWCGAPYQPMDKLVKSIDDSVYFVDNVGRIIKEAKNNNKTIIKTEGEQLTNIVKYLVDVATKEEIKVPALWLDKIPDFIYVDQLKEKYNYQTMKLDINPIIGELDDPFNQRQAVLTLPLSREGNTLIYGSTGSGKELMLNSILYSTLKEHTSEEVNFYIIDFGAETLKQFQEAPHVGDVLLLNDGEKITNLFKTLRTEVEIRRKLFSKYNGDYNYYCKSSGQTLPTIVVMINNYDVFSEMYDQYEDTMLQLTRDGLKCGIVFICTVTSVSAVRYRLQQNFGQMLTLQLNDESNYSSVLGRTGGITPSKAVGRGLIKLEEIYEFQTAYICETENQTEFVKEFCEELKKTNTFYAKEVPVLPEKVSIDFVRNYITGINNLPIGVGKQSLQVIPYNFKNRLGTLVSSIDNSYFDKFIYGLVEEFKLLKDTMIVVIDADDILNQNNLAGTIYNNATFDDIFAKTVNEMSNREKIYTENNFNYNALNNMKQIMCIIVGVDSFKNKLAPANQPRFDAMFGKGNSGLKLNFILVDTIDKFKKVEYDNWYKTSVSNSDGIWVGEGISEQFTIKIAKVTKELRAEITSEFGYVITKGKAELIKLLTGSQTTSQQVPVVNMDEPIFKEESSDLDKTPEEMIKEMEI